MAKLKARAEPTKECEARVKWEALLFRTNGKITVQELYRFEVDFREAQSGVPEITEEESYRHLLSRLPQHLSGWVLDEESRLRLAQPQLKFILPRAFNEVLVKNFVREALNTDPIEVLKMSSGIFKVTLGNWMVAKKSLELDGRRIDGLDRDLNISEMQPKLMVDQVFDLIRRKLESRERGDNYLRQGGHQSRDRFRTPTRDSPDMLGRQVQRPKKIQRNKKIQRARGN